MPFSVGTDSVAGTATRNGQEDEWTGTERKGGGGLYKNIQVNNIASYIIMCRRLRDGNPCLKDQLEDLKHVGKMTFWKI